MVLKSLLPSKIEESACETWAEQKFKLEKERMRRTKKNGEFEKWKKKLGKKKAGERGGTKMDREKRSRRKGEFKPRKWARAMKNEREREI